MTVRISHLKDPLEDSDALGAMGVVGDQGGPNACCIPLIRSTLSGPHES
jgi:hypothetical protein